MLERIETWRMWVLMRPRAVKDWSKGRVTLLGDAAHPMLQYLAQGAAWRPRMRSALADNVSEQPDEPCPPAFRAYVQQRYLPPRGCRSWRASTATFNTPADRRPSCATQAARPAHAGAVLRRRRLAVRGNLTITASAIALASPLNSRI